MSFPMLLVKLLCPLKLDEDFVCTSMLLFSSEMLQMFFGVKSQVEVTKVELRFLNTLVPEDIPQMLKKPFHSR